MKIKLSKFWMLFFLLLTDVYPSMAFKIKPISHTFASTGSDATHSYELINDSNEPEAIQISVVKREMDLDGKEKYTPADDDFLIYPPAIILQPNTSQTVLVQWLGDPNPTQELNYRLISEQVPIPLRNPEQKNPTTTKATIRILHKFQGSLYIRPTGIDIQPKLTLESVTVQNDKDKSSISMIFNNQGAVCTILRNLKISLTSAGKTVELTAEQLKDITNHNILANHKRRFVIPYPADLPQGTVTATFDYKP